AKRDMLADTDGAADHLDRVKSSLAGSLVGMVHSINLPITSSQVSELMRELNTSEFDKQQRAEICNALGAKLVHSRVEPALGPTECQKFTDKNSIMNYLTAKDWLALSDKSVPFSDASKRKIIIDRLSRGGFYKPAIPAAEDCAAAVASAVWDGSISAVDLHNATHSFMSEFRDQRSKSCDLPVIRQWPPSPDALPVATRQALYPEADDQPLQMAVDTFVVVRKLTSCRDVNKNVRGELKQPATALVSASRRAPPACAGGAPQLPGMPLDVAGFLSAAGACGISQEQALLLGSQMLRGGGQLGSGRPARSNSSVFVEEFDCEQPPSLASQLAQEMQLAPQRVAIAAAAPTPCSMVVPVSPVAPALASAASASAAALADFGVARSKVVVPEPICADGLTELDNIKAMEREHEALVEKAKQKKLDAATEPSGADLESPSASKGPKGMPKKI
ncbi:unnamed protein product, partial [Prorocentrum cordatum]